MSEQRGYGWLQSYSGYPISASLTSATSSAILVEDYNNHSVQAYVSGSNCSGSLIVEAANFDVSYSWTVVTTSQVSTSSLIIPLTVGRRKYLRHKLNVVGAASGSVYQISGP